MTPECPLCGNWDATLLGVLNLLTWVRCRACGADYTVDKEETNGNEEE